MKANIKMENDMVIIHAAGDMEDIYWRSPVLEVEYNGAKVKAMPVRLIEFMKENDIEIIAR